MTTDTQPGPIKSGRPAKDATKKKFYDGELYKLLAKTMPQHVEGGRLSPKLVADALNIARYTVYKWLNSDKLSSKGARQLIEASGGKLSIKDLSKFVLS